MTDLQTLLREVDALSPHDLNQLYEYIDHRRRMTWWIVSPENLARIDELMRPVQAEAAQMSEDEVNAAIDTAIAEVRRERRNHSGSD